MTLAQVISFIILLLLPVTFYILRILAQRLPEHQRIHLEQFARMAVSQVEQESKGREISNSTKRQFAIASIATLFKAFKLPMPSDEAIGIAIEAAVLLLPKTHKTSE